MAFCIVDLSSSIAYSIHYPGTLTKDSPWAYGPVLEIFGGSHSCNPIDVFFDGDRTGMPNLSVLANPTSRQYTAWPRIGNRKYSYPKSITFIKVLCHYVVKYIHKSQKVCQLYPLECTCSVNYTLWEVMNIK